jgi:hypothetical protein
MVLGYPRRDLTSYGLRQADASFLWWRDGRTLADRKFDRDRLAHWGRFAIAVCAIAFAAQPMRQSGAFSVIRKDDLSHVPAEAREILSISENARIGSPSPYIETIYVVSPIKLSQTRLAEFAEIGIGNRLWPENQRHNSVTWNVNVTEAVRQPAIRQIPIEIAPHINGLGSPSVLPFWDDFKNVAVYSFKPNVFQKHISAELLSLSILRSCRPVKIAASIAPPAATAVKNKAIPPAIFSKVQ